MLAGGTVAGQLIALASVPVLSRLYGPEDFGVLAVYASLLAGLVVVVTLRYETAIAVAEDEKEAASLLVLSLTVCLGVSVGSALLLALLGDSIARWTSTPSIRPYLWLVPVSGFAAGIYQSFSFWAIRERKYRRLALTKITQNLWMVVTQIVLGALRGGPLGLVVGDGFKWAGGSSTLVAAAWRKDARLLKGVRRRALIAGARKYWKFPLLSAPSSLANTLGQQLPALIIAGFYGPRVAGSFYLVQKVLAVPVTFVGRAIGDTYIGEFAQRLRTDRSGAQRLYRKLTRLLITVGFPPTIVLAVGGGVLLPWALGSQWHDAGLYLQVVAVMFLAKFVVNPLSHTLVLLQRQGTQLAWDLGRLAFVNGSIFFVARSKATPLAAVTAYAVSMLAAYVAMYYLCRRALSSQPPLPSTPHVIPSEMAIPVTAQEGVAMDDVGGMPAGATRRNVIP